MKNLTVNLMEFRRYYSMLINQGMAPADVNARLARAYFLSAKDLTKVLELITLN